jgi:hypothetical protein
MSEPEKQISISHDEALSSNLPLELNKSIDTVHNDEALKVIVEYNGEREWTPAEENKLRRKIDWRLMPVLCLTYGLQYYDKAMLSQAVCYTLGHHLLCANSSIRLCSDFEQI